MGAFQTHKDKWSGCQRCDLHQARTRVVLARGKLPADILFIGEAPGASEDVLGKPFVGPAGKLLDRMIKDATARLDLRVAITNLICCIPKDKGSKIGEPPPEAIKACKPRLKEFVRIASPKLVVLVGKLARCQGLDVVPANLPLCTIAHPAYLLRLEIARRGLAIQRETITLSDNVEAVFG